jgi:cytochrome c-type biogenesis protein CcmH
VNAIAKKLYCPVCESTPLDVCPTEACKDWREQIRQMLVDGKTEDEILTYFEEQYGAKVLATPPASGLNWLVYVIPPLLILAGAVILFRSMRAWTKPQKTEASLGGESEAKGTSSEKDDYVSRFEEELKKRK